jgi:hypothetical protein
MNVNRVLGGLLFAAIVICGVDARLVRLMFADRSAFADTLTRAPDLQAPEYPRFLEEIARLTKPGDSIAILVPMRHWTGGYAYAYYRATYFLTGRHVIPLVDEGDLLHPERLDEARLLAAWKMPVPPEPYVPVWSGYGGVLLRRAP